MAFVLYLVGAVLAGAGAALPLFVALDGTRRLRRGVIGAVESFVLLMVAIAVARLALGRDFVVPSVVCVVTWLAIVVVRALRAAR